MLHRRRPLATITLTIAALAAMLVTPTIAHADTSTDQNEGYFDPHAQAVKVPVAQGPVALGVAVRVEGGPLAITPCPAAVVCTYDRVDFTGAMYYYSGPFKTCITVGEPWYHMISAVINNKDIPVTLYYNICSSNLWNIKVPANDFARFGFDPLNDHVHSLRIDF